MAAIAQIPAVAPTSIHRSVKGIPGMNPFGTCADPTPSHDQPTGIDATISAPSRSIHLRPLVRNCRMSSAYLLTSSRESRRDIQTISVAAQSTSAIPK